MDDAANTVTPAEDEPSVLGDATSVADAREAATLPHPSTETAPADPWKRVRKLALKQLDRFMALEPQVLKGDDPDAIHDIRVASRRLQQVLDLLHPTPRPGEVRKLRRRIRRTRRALGEVRNCDVQLARVEKTLTGRRAPRRETWEAVRHYLLQRRADAFEKAARKLSRLNLAVFYVRMKDLLAPNGHPRPAHPGHHHGDADRPSPELFHERVADSLQRVWEAFEAQVATSHRDPQVGVIHGVRIAAKRLRYLVEVLHEFDVAGSSETLTWLRALQEHLGNWHDLEVLEQMMVEMVARPAYLRDHLEIAMSVEKLILRNRAGKDKFRERYFQITADTTDFRRVKDWVAGLLSGLEIQS